MRAGLLILLLTMALPVAAAAGHGVALLVVNDDYRDGPGDLPSTATPAGVASLALALEAKGFSTTLRENLSRGELRFTIENFARTAPTNGVALIYYFGRLLASQGDADSDIFLRPVENRADPVTYPVGGDASIDDVLDVLRDESGVAMSFVLLEGTAGESGRNIADRVAGIETRDKTFLAYAERGLADAMAALLDEGQMNSSTAIHAAVFEAGGWSTEPWQFTMPDIISPLHPPGEIAEGRLAGDEWVNPLGTVFAWCPGRPVASGDGGATGFWLGKYEVTRREFDLVTPRKPKGALASAPNHPRDAVRYDDILLFIAELNRRERFFKRLPEGWEYALPTGEEWEYASRAGSASRFYFGDDAGMLTEHANIADRSLLDTGDEYFLYADGSFDDGHARLAPVGSYRASPWGFHDLYGNLWEWTASGGEGEESMPPARGCSWVSLAGYCDAGFVHRFARVTERNFIGFRLVLRRKALAYVSGSH